MAKSATIWSACGYLYQTLNALGIYEYVKLAKLAMCQVLGFVEDEHCFNISFFMKSKLCNCLTTHLDMCVRMFSQDSYNLESFPYTMDIITYKEKKIIIILMLEVYTFNIFVEGLFGNNRLVV